MPVDSGGANYLSSGDGNDEERGSCSDAEKVSPLASMHKKTKVPLAGLYSRKDNKAPRTLQIIVRRVGTERERFGSVSFSLKRFATSSAQSLCHWVTLYDSLDDDLFEGTLGTDDDFDYPRVLLDYQIVSSKFTSMARKAERLGSALTQARMNQDRQIENRNFVPGKVTLRKSTTSKAKKTVNVSQTLEFVETRAAKVAAQRAPFEGRVLTDQK